MRAETLISTVVNAVLPAAVIWFAELPPPDRLVGAGGIVGPMTGAAGLASFVMTMVLTAIVRARVRRGTLPALDWPREQRGALRWLPDAVLLRAAAIALLAIVLLVPAGMAVVALLDIVPLDRVGFLIFNLVFGAVVGIVMTRFVVLSALADRVPA